jgi:hypothetical protein
VANQTGRYKSGPGHGRDLDRSQHARGRLRRGLDAGTASFFSANSGGGWWIASHRWTAASRFTTVGVYRQATHDPGPVLQI